MSSKQKMNLTDQEAFKVTKIYEHVKSRKFLEQLCLECIQDVKQKPAYQSLRGMVDRLLTNSMLGTAGTIDDAERITAMRMQVAECGMLAYTIDCVVAEVVCNKLEKEYFSMVKDVITDIAAKHNVEVIDDTPIPTENHANRVEEEIKVESISNQGSPGCSSGRNAAAKSRSPVKSTAEKSSPKSILKSRNLTMNGDLSKVSPSKGKSAYLVQKMDRPNTRNYNGENKIGDEIRAVDIPIQRSHNQVVDIVISKEIGPNAACREIRANQVEVHAGNVTNRPQSVLEIVSSPIPSNNSSNSTCKVVVVSSHGAIIKHVINHDNASANFSQAGSNSSASAHSVPSASVVESATPNESITEGEGKSPRKVASPKKCSSFVPKRDAENLDESLSESDVEKAFSVGSVSPVHTSDLSSFDDLISLSEDDEEGNSKKKIRLKDANNIFLDGKLPELYRKKKRVRPKSSPKNKSSAEKVVQAEQDSSSEDESSDWTPRKFLPQRRRKPNSKYDSEIYKCNLKQFMNSEDPEFKDGKHPPHNRTEPRTLKKISLDPVSEDILSIATNLPLSKQNGGSSIDSKVNGNDLLKGPILNATADLVVRKRGRPRKSNQDADSNSFSEKDKNDLSEELSPIPDSANRKRGRPRKTAETIISWKRISDSDSLEGTPKRLRNDSADSPQMRMADISPSKEKNSQRYSSAELYKPRPNISSLGSRGHRVVTLCSTP